MPVLALAACTPSDGPDAEEAATEPETATQSETATEPEVRQGEVHEPAEASTVLGGTSPAAVATSTSQSLFASAPVVVLAGEEDLAGQLRGASAAVALGAPLLLTGDDAGLAAEIGRLGAEWVLAVGAAELPAGGAGVAPDDGASGAGEDEDEDDAAGSASGGPVLVRAPQSDDALAEMLGMNAGGVTSADTGTEITHVAALEPGAFTPLTPGAAAEPATTGGEDTAADAAEAETSTGGTTGAGSESASPDSETGTLPPTEPAEALAGVAVLTSGEAAQVAAVATARSAGAQVEVVPGGDPRATSETVQAIAALEAEHVVALGDAFGDAEAVAWRTATAATGVELPGGGQLVFPGKRYVALYGTPSTTALGVLGEQDVPATVQRAAEHAAPYAELTQDTVVPAMEIIATVAAGQAGPDGNYSNELAVEDLRPLVEAAGEAGQYVVLDLQPGRASFVDQAAIYADLLALPHVGLALDPEWNLGPDEVHMVKIGSATSEEVNEVVDWLADFTRERNLPQKMLVLHQFQVRMIQEVSEVDLSRSELAVLVHADGQGGQPAKQGTWATLHANAPDIEWWGWKNFYDEDLPMLTPEQTMRVEPMPHFISYQ
ncbi:hypothetical protein [Serinibacter arcticus]|uniref:hypothetical protein n=1 Tax=Serinibacter arcticus TaxID=1655435 RepID=UPI0010923AB5|nr:hypothetical protein [Serinibacter arcticus]